MFEIDQGIAHRQSYRKDPASAHYMAAHNNIELDVSPTSQSRIEQLQVKMPDGVVLELVRGAHGLQRAEPDTMQETGTIQLALQLMGEAVIVTDAAGRVIFLNSDAEKLTGWKFEDAQSQLASTVFQVVQDINVNLVEPFTESSLEELHHGEQTNTEYVLLLSKDNRQLVIDYSVTLLRGSDGAVEGTLLVFRNINGTSSSARSRTWQTNYDPLTQLMNRCFFEQYLERVVCNSRILDQQHVLCYIDVDRFKIINEVGGHIAGDEFLCQISQLFRQRVRKTDILARLGSDEFALILHQCELEQALKVVQSLCEEVQKLRFFWKNNTFNLTISVGLVLLNNHYDSLSSALSAADAACQTAKSHGRNRIHVYQPETDGLHRRTEMHWAMRLFNALETDQFRLYCQSIVPLQTSKPNQPIQGCAGHHEVLLRLQTESGEVISAGEFIPVAERYGLMHLIDRWVIRSLFTQLGHIKCQGGPSCRYTVNLSGASLNDDQFLDFVHEQLIEHAIPPRMICFEITETVAISNLDHVSKFIDRLRGLGCCFALDDFGSGMSSFGYLRSFPVDYVKIDGSFIRDITKSKIASEIVESINRIGRVMGIKTIAEFVENAEIFEQLRGIGVDYGQGYGIDRPRPLSEVLASVHQCPSLAIPDLQNL